MNIDRRAPESMESGSPVAAFILLMSLLTGCVSIPTPMERRAHADQLAQQNQHNQWGQTPLIVDADKINGVAQPNQWSLTPLIFRPRQFKSDATLSIYIEGDGFAWVTSSTPSVDPTPIDPLALRLALAQPTGNAAYIGRPCQYVDAEHTGCPQRYWTEARFAPEVVAAVEAAVDVLKRQAGAQQLILVGFSGGAAVAALIAERRSDVVRLITFAGNLDHRAWTSFHRIQPLSGSLNAADNASRLADLPQTHFIGGRDKIIPPELAYQWPLAFRGANNANLRIIPDYTHNCCWVKSMGSDSIGSVVPNH